jgi:mannosyltransferase OCH1-like enzyme
VTHQIWFQGWVNLPEKYRDDTERLSILNQNWEHKKWDEESLRSECEKFSQEALAKFDGFTHMIQKIDFGRYMVLHNYGGVSVDCDAECIRPLDKIPHIDFFNLIICKNPLNKIENKIASFGLSSDLVMLNNATICCSKEHPLMKRFIEFLIENESWNEDETLDTHLKTGPLILSIFFNSFIDEFFIIDSEVFEPWGHVTKRTILNHKYDHSWVDSYWVPFLHLYKFIKNNLIWILLFFSILIKFLFVRKVLEKSLV